MVDFQKRTLNIEWELISLILSDKEILNRALIELEPHDFEEDRCREIFNSIREWKGDVEPCKIIDFLGEDACKVVSWAALREVKIYDKMKLADDYIKRIKRGRVNQKLESLRKEISEAESSGKTDSLRDLLHQYQNLIAQAKSYS
jgi:replicative DNA helicase